MENRLSLRTGIREALIFLCLVSTAGAGDNFPQPLTIGSEGAAATEADSVYEQTANWVHTEPSPETNCGTCAGANCGDSCTAAAGTGRFSGPLPSRTHLSGDWGGLRNDLADNGVLFDLFATQFYQGVTSGGRSRAWEYGGKLDYLLKLDGGKLNLSEGLFLDLHAETRFGDSVNPLSGQLSPPNTAMLFPEANGNTTALTGFKITQALSENFVVFMGKINTLDEYPIRYSPEIGLERPGIGGFMNTSLVFNQVMGRTVPYSALGIGAAVLKDGFPILSVTIFDPQERATIGLEDPFERGVVFVPTLLLPASPFGKPGIYQFGATYSNAEYSSVDPSDYQLIPQVGIVAGQQTGSWSFYTNFYQALWVDPCDKKRTWGVFGQFGVSDGNPNAVQYVANGGLAGRSMLPGRTLDTFGVGYFFVGLSDEFKSLLPRLLPQQDEQGVELFYNLAVTPAARLTFDLQVAQPSLQRLDTTVTPGMRLALKF